MGARRSPPLLLPCLSPPPTSGSGCLPSLAPPRLTWRARQVVIRYEVREPKVGCCQCSDMNQSGLIALVALIFVCWPLACIPCCMQSCHESYQVPVFGPPAYQPPVCPFVAPPAQGIPTTGKGSGRGALPEVRGLRRRGGGSCAVESY